MEKLAMLLNAYIFEIGKIAGALEEREIIGSLVNRKLLERIYVLQGEKVGVLNSSIQNHRGIFSVVSNEIIEPYLGYREEMRDIMADVTFHEWYLYLKCAL
jgi:hypothetical protein